jgi:hypothetical protein
MEERSSMSEEGGAASATAIPPVPARARGSWTTFLAVVLAFVIGVAIAIAAMFYFQGRWAGSPSRPAVAADPYPRSGVALRPLSTDAGQMLDGRVVQLEERLNRITVEAQAASGNAARAEGLLVAFAARRALDSGTPLGYVEGQLRLRFGQAQPRAVATIINAAREPVTLADLRAGLATVSDQLTTAGPQSSWWDSVEHEARALLTIRRSSTPSPRPEAAMERALRYIDAGRVSAALTEVEAMPGRAAADRWMQFARRYIEARRALDLIETAAILEPRQLRGVDGGPVARTSPLAP